MSEVELDDNGEPIVEVIISDKVYAPNTQAQLAWLSYNNAVVRAIYEAKPAGKRSTYEQAYLDGTLEAWAAERARIDALRAAARARRTDAVSE